MFWTDSLHPSYLRFFIYNNMGVSAMDALATGPLLTAYALALGAPPWMAGALAGLPYLGVLMGVAGADLVQRGYSSKRVTFWFSLISRPFYLFCAFLACAAWWPNRPLWLLFAVGCCYLLGGVSIGAYYPWLKSLLPDDQIPSFVQYKYISSKSMYVVFTLVTVLFFFLVQTDGGKTPVWSYAPVFALAGGCGLLACFALSFIPDARTEEERSAINWSVLRGVWSVPQNRRVFLLVGLGFFAVYYLVGFLPVFALQFAKISVAWLTVCSFGMQAVFLFSVPFWGILQRKNLVRALSVPFGLLCTAFVWLAGLSGVNGGGVWGTLFAFLFCGVILAGVQSGFDAFVLRQAPASKSPVYFMFVSLVRLPAALGPVSAGACLHGIQKSFPAWSASLVWLGFFGAGLVMALCVLMYSLNIHFSEKQ